MEYLKILQLPKLEEQFKEKGEELAKTVARCQKMVVTEDNYKSIKTIRTALRKEFGEVQDAFKVKKAQVLEPWNTVEGAYNEYIRDGFRKADAALKEKINSVEDGLKKEKADALKTYFSEYAEAEQVPVKYEDTEFKVGLSNSLTSLKAEARAFVDNVKTEMKMIEVHDDSGPIMAEYMKDFNLGRATMKVAEDKRKQREAAELVERLRKADEEQREHEARVEEYAKPPEEIRSARFLVRGTLTELKRLSKFLQANNYDYENIKED